MTTVDWEHYPLVAQHHDGRTWLQIVADEQLAPNTIDAYGRGLNDYLSICARLGIGVNAVTREHIAKFIRDMNERPNPSGRCGSSGVGLANSTQQQRLTAVRLFYDYLIEEGVRDTNPVRRGRRAKGARAGEEPSRGLIPRYYKNPWIPTHEQWHAILQAAREEPLRNRLMFSMSYDAALRREEISALNVTDIDPAYQMIRIRAEITKGRRQRDVPFSISTSELYVAYVRYRRTLSQARGPLFLSESPRNYAQPISFWTWSKVVERIARRADVEEFTTHSLRHLCLTDLARDGWDINEIATFAGHRSTDTTMLYINLSGRELAKKVSRAMASVHSWRAKMTAEALYAEK